MTVRTTALCALLLAALYTSCGGSSSGGSGGAGTSGAGAGAGTGGAGTGGVGTGGAAGASGSSSTAEQCKAEACADLPGCTGCEEWCERSCSAEGCGYGIGCQADYVAACFAGKTCDAVSSQNTLLKDAEIYACLAGVPFNEVCEFGAGSPETCWQCTYASCSIALQACDSDVECQKWLGCITQQDCPISGAPDNPECYRECDDAYPAAAALYEPVYSCTCASCPICNVHQGACGV